ARVIAGRLVRGLSGTGAVSAVGRLLTVVGTRCIPARSGVARGHGGGRQPDPGLVLGAGRLDRDLQAVEGPEHRGHPGGLHVPFAVRRALAGPAHVIEGQAVARARDAVGDGRVGELATLGDVVDGEVGIAGIRLAYRDGVAALVADRDRLHARGRDVGDLRDQPARGVVRQLRVAVDQPARRITGDARVAVVALATVAQDHLEVRLAQALARDPLAARALLLRVLHAEAVVQLGVRGFLLDPARLGKAEKQLAKLRHVGRVSALGRHDPVVVLAHDANLAVGIGDPYRGDLVQARLEARQQ